MPMENPTKPCLYSFFQGRKYVLTRRGRENSSKKALLSEPKNESKDKGASKNQNFKKFKGNKIIPMGSYALYQNGSGLV